MILDALRNASRRLRARSGNTVLSIGILSLGLLAAMFLFGSINTMVLRPLPFPEGERLVALGWVQPSRGSEVGGFGTRDWLAIREALPMFDEVGSRAGRPRSTSVGASAWRATTVRRSTRTCCGCSTCSPCSGAASRPTTTAPARH